MGLLAFISCTAPLILVRVALFATKVISATTGALAVVEVVTAHSLVSVKVLLSLICAALPQIGFPHINLALNQLHLGKGNATN